MEKVICLHCHKEIPPEKVENHTCINEILDYLVEGIVQTKERECGNSGLNWKDYYDHLMERRCK